MRLVCPNCEAKYEVPDDAIPDTGRDVQCTNCGHSWYQMRGRTSAAPLVGPAPGADAAEVVEPAAEPTAVPQAIAQPSPVNQSAETDAAGAVEAVPDTDEDAFVEATLQDQAPSEELSAPEAAADPAQSDAVVEQALAWTETVALQDAEPVADAAPEDETEPVVDATGSPDMAAEAGPMPEPSPVTEGAAEPEASVIAVETVADLVAVQATTEAVPEDILDVAAEAVSDATIDDSPAPAPNYAVDDSVLAILREEAEREANARRAEALESQTDLGIDSAMPRKSGLLAVEAETKPAARRDLLPDVEEINSTLRPSEMHDGADAPDFVAPPPEAPRGFRSGFLSLMTIAILAAALYLVAPRLAVMVPALSGPLESYISMIDSLRLGLDGMMRSATVAISDG